MQNHPFPEPHAARVRPLWSLDPAIAFLNHGSFGACPRAVLDAQTRLRERMERDAIQFFLRDLERLMDAARAALAGFVGADPDDVAFVPNATAGVNTVLRSLELQPGDALLTTDHEYNACRNALEAVAARAGARVEIASIPFPIASPDDVVGALLERAGPRTRLALVDHITSQTGVVLPIERIVAELATRGIDTLVDGAHAPGMLPLDVTAIGAAYFTGNCHKWVCAPKGAAFLHVRRDRQAGIRPLSVSHGANATRTDRSRFRLEFDWTGTFDPSPYLCIPDALRFMEGLLPGGWPALMEHNQRTALAARDLLCGALGCAPPSPDSMIGTLASLPLPEGRKDPPRSALDLDPLQEALFDRFGVEVPVIPWTAAPPTAAASPRLACRRLLRISAQIYNERGDYARLVQALREILPAACAVVPAAALPLP